MDTYLLRLIIMSHQYFPLQNIQPILIKCPKLVSSNFILNNNAAKMYLSCDFVFIPVPSHVENITVTPTNPNTIIVTWPAPLTPNGPLDKIMYFVKWTTQLDDGVHDRMSDAIMQNSSDPYNGDLITKEITDLEADQTYSIKVGCSFILTPLSI